MLHCRGVAIAQKSHPPSLLGVLLRKYFHHLWYSNFCIWGPWQIHYWCRIPRQDSNTEWRCSGHKSKTPYLTSMNPLQGDAAFKLHTHLYCSYKTDGYLDSSHRFKKFKNLITALVTNWNTTKALRENKTLQVSSYKWHIRQWVAGTYLPHCKGS